MPYRVALLGFSDAERSALARYLGPAQPRQPSYTLVATLTDADILLADAEHGPSVRLVLDTERLRETLFVGSRAPAGHVAAVARPIDALALLRELDRIARTGLTPSGGAQDRSLHGSIVRAMQRRPEAVQRPPLSDLDQQAPQGRVLADGAVALPGDPGMPAPEPGLTLRELPPPPAKPPKRPKAQLLPELPRVLLVDDSAVALRALEVRLGLWRLEIDRAHHSQAALDLLARHSYDLVFLDLDLGRQSDLDGLALCQHIKQTPALMNALVVMVSAHHSQLDRVRGTLAGCDAYLGKPLDYPALQQWMQRQGLPLRSGQAAAPG